jgi:hypothetical protein
MPLTRVKIADSTERRSFIDGSDARIVMGQDEKALIHLRQEMRRRGDRMVRTSMRPRSLPTVSTCSTSPDGVFPRLVRPLAHRGARAASLPGAARGDSPLPEACGSDPGFVCGRGRARSAGSGGRRTRPWSRRHDAGAVLFGERLDQLGREEPGDLAHVVGGAISEHAVAASVTASMLSVSSLQKHRRMEDGFAVVITHCTLSRLAKLGAPRKLRIATAGTAGSLPGVAALVGTKGRWAPTRRGCGSLICKTLVQAAWSTCGVRRSPRTNIETVMTAMRRSSHSEALRM